MKPDSRLIKVLVVDDEEDARMLVADILEDKYQINYAENVAEALEKMAQDAPDIVVSDIKMPGEDGLSLLKRISKKDKKINTIMVTGHGDKKIAIEALTDGAFGFLEKPFDDQELLQVVARAREDILLSEALKIAEDRANHAEKLASLGVLAAGVAHEISNPLGIIKSALEVLKIEWKSKMSAQDRELFEMQERSIERIKAIVSGIRIYSRKDNGANISINVQQLLDDTLKIIGKIFHKNGVSIDLETESAGLWIKGDFGKLQQVLLNFMNNARDAVQKIEKPSISVRTFCEKDKVYIAVEDNGPGIAPENISKIFDPFFTTKDIGQGTGIGLSISQTLILEMGGEIRVESPSEQGACFTIIFSKVAKPDEDQLPKAG